MKKQTFARLLVWILFVPVAINLNSCKKEDNPATPANTIEGSYKISALSVEPKALGLYNDLIAASKLLFNNTTCLNDIITTFKADGTATTDNPTACQSPNFPVPVSTFTGIDAGSKWTLSGDKLTVTKSDNTKTEYTVVSNVGGLLKLQWQGTLNYPVPSSTVYTFTMDLKKQ